VLPEEFVSVVQVATIERREKRVEVVVEDTEIKQEQSEKREVALPQAVKEIEDDWFVLFDLPIREPSFVPPGIANFLLCFSSVLPYGLT